MSVHDVYPSRRRKCQTGYEVEALTYESVFQYRLIPAMAALTFLALAPFLHIVGTAYFAPKPDVDRKACRNHCFDTVYRGNYEWAPSHYKPVYFNAVPETLQIVIHTLVYIIITYEIIRHVTIWWLTSSLRYRMLLSVATFVYPIYYTWWSFFNYINERFHVYWYHDAFFAVTEMVSLLYFVHFCDAGNKINATKLLIPFTLNLTHILVSGFDQFLGYSATIAGKDESYRNWGLFIPDFMITLVCVYEVYRLSTKNRTAVQDMFYKEELAIALLFVLMSCVLLGTIFSQ